MIEPIYDDVFLHGSQMIDKLARTTTIVNPPHGHYRPDHLERVVAEMRRRGPPVIRASWDEQGGMWHAREGTHRLRAARILGLGPILIPVPWRRTSLGRERARHAATRHAHEFDVVEVSCGPAAQAS